MNSPASHRDRPLHRWILTALAVGLAASTACEPYPTQTADDGEGSASATESAEAAAGSSDGSGDGSGMPTLDDGPPGPDEMPEGARLLEDFEEPLYAHQPTPVDPSEVPPIPTVADGDDGDPGEVGADGEPASDDEGVTMFGLENRLLVGRHFFADAEGAEFNEIHFLGSMVIIVMRDGSEVAFPADMSGHHPLCADVPACVVLLAPDGAATPFYFTGIYGSAAPFSIIARAECRIAALHRDGPWHLILQAIADEQGSNLTHQSDAAICWNPGLVPYREVPSWWQQRDEDAYREARARYRAEREAGMNPGATLTPPSPNMPYPDPDDVAEGRFGPVGLDGTLLPDGTPGTAVGPGMLPGGGMPMIPGEMPPMPDGIPEDGVTAPE